MKPIRIQRKRIKGWRMPENTISVCRPGAWGNPYKVTKEGKCWFVIDEKLNRKMECEDELQAIRYSLELFQKMALKHRWDYYAPFYLKGRNLACWCPLDKPCHTDILLKLANDNYDKQ